MKLLNKIPNILSITRIPLSLVLFLLIPFSFEYLTVYFICGLTDIFDGFIARKYGLETYIGSILDSIADFVFFIIAFITMLPIILTINFGILLWIILIALIRIFSLLVSYHKYSKSVFLHTYSNKITGLMIFIAPFFVTLININLLTIILCIIAMYSSIEELLIHIYSDSLDLNIKSIF